MVRLWNRASEGIGVVENTLPYEAINQPPTAGNGLVI